jgi:hypothetical protein
VNILVRTAMEDDRFTDAVENEQQETVTNEIPEYYESDDYDDYEDFLDDDLNDTEIWTEATGGQF